MDRLLPVVHRFSPVAILALFCIGLLIAVVLTHFEVEVTTHALTQLFFFPLIVFVMSQIELGGTAIPGWVCGTALVGALCGAVFTYTHVDLIRGAFVVAPLEGDRSDSDTKIMRDRIRRPLGTAGLALVGTHAAVISSQADAEKLLQNDSTLGGVVWGSTRWLNVSLRVHESLALSSLPRESFVIQYLRGHRYRDLKVVTGVPAIGISNSADASTLLFIGNMIPLWRDFPAQLSEGREDGADFEQKLRSVAALKAHWSSFSHRALPMWMTGTLHLVRAISAEQLESGELSCAVRSLEAALTQLRPSDNPELQAAVRNNLALALLMQGEIDVTSDNPRKAAAKMLKEACKLQKIFRQKLNGSAISSFNLSILKGKHGQHQRRTRNN